LINVENSFDISMLVIFQFKSLESSKSRTPSKKLSVSRFLFVGYLSFYTRRRRRKL